MSAVENTKYESWTIKKIVTAIKEETIENINIKVPKFQRNLVWSEDQKNMFIDSIKQGFPIGTLLFYNSANSKEYILIDGLQRSSTMKEFVDNPSAFLGEQDIDDCIVNDLYDLFGIKEIDDSECCSEDETIDKNDNLKTIMDRNDFVASLKEEIKNHINGSDLFSNLLLSDLANHLLNTFSNVVPDLNLLNQTLIKLEPIVKDYKELYTDILNSIMPVMIFSGNESDLPTVFERINNQGTQLGKYQIYAASWAVKGYSVKVENEEIINHILAKYDSFIESGYVLDDYDRDEILEAKEISIFEFVLGYGKYISEKYPALFIKDKSVQDINQSGFELLNACLGRTNKDIKDLHEALHDLDVNKFTKCLDEVVGIVYNYLKQLIDFKGNKRETITVFHSQNQIISIVASTFREKYKIIKNDIADNEGWDDTKKILEKTIPQYYIYDIISKNWAEGGFGKIYAILNENKYLVPIEKESWDIKLTDWFNDMNNRREKKNVASPKNVEKLFLNAIYVTLFSAQDQLVDSKKFDIEHLATKDILKKAIKDHNWEQGLPISSIGNLCYLPEYDNRSKGANTIYQDRAYLKYLSSKNMDISDIEAKYSFTEEDDLAWLNYSYNDDEYKEYLDAYIEFLKKRFEKMKLHFYKSIGVIVDETSDEDNDDSQIIE